MSWLFSFRNLLSSVNTRTVYFYSIVIGLMAGLGAIVFNELLLRSTQAVLGSLAHLHVPQPSGEAGELVEPLQPVRRWALVFLPALGGLVAGLLVKTFAPEAEGTGTDGYIDAFHNKAGAMRSRVPLVKSLATLATLSTGGSAGKEGPTAQIGAGIGSALGQFLSMGARARRTLMVAGAAAGLGAIFRAPLGGALTAVEVLYKEDLETDALTPAILASVSAYTVFCSVNGYDHVFHFEHEVFHTPMEFVIYTVLGLVCSAAGVLYIKILHGSKRLFFDRLPVHRYLVPPIGGLMVGAVGFVFPQALGQGLGYVQQLILGEPMAGMPASISLLALLALLKIVTTSCTISSGGSGGVFAPSLFIGAMLGGCVGTIGQQLFPQLVPSVSPYVVVGMGAFFAGVANAPIASLMMVCELTGAYGLLPPLMLVATIALVTTRRWSIYTHQVDNKFFSRAHLWEMNPHVLQRMTVGEMTRGIYHRQAIVAQDAPLYQLMRIAGELGETDLILRDAEGELAGLVSLNDLEQEGSGEHLGNLVLAADVTHRRSTFLRPEDNLIRALEIFQDRDFDKVPVVDTSHGGRRLLGHIQYADVLAFYKRSHAAPHEWAVPDGKPLATDSQSPSR